MLPDVRLEPRVISAGSTDDVVVETKSRKQTNQIQETMFSTNFDQKR